MIMFDGAPVLYHLKNARMNFFVFARYPLRGEDGKTIKDVTPYQTMLDQANSTMELLKRIENRIKRVMRIPRTWVRKLKESESLVLALRETRATTSEWHDGYFTLLKYLESLNG